MTTKLLDQTDARGLSEVSTIALAAVIGLGLIFAAGFSHAGGMHDVAHDARHATGFPCH
jgi:cobalt transporter subunit CbtB